MIPEALESARQKDQSAATWKGTVLCVDESESVPTATGNNGSHRRFCQ